MVIFFAECRDTNTYFLVYHIACAHRDHVLAPVFALEADGMVLRPGSAIFGVTSALKYAFLLAGQVAPDIKNLSVKQVIFDLFCEAEDEENQNYICTKSIIRDRMIEVTYA